MSPPPLQPKTETTTNVKNNRRQTTHLKINRDSHSIKKTSSSSPSNKQQQRQPVIIYTHSPRVIQTNPRDFMQLVQKLTGLSRSPQQDQGQGQQQQQQQQREKQPQPKCEAEEAEVEYPRKEEVYKEENETSSFITEENNCIRGNSMVGEMKSCLVAAPPPLMEPPPPMFPYVNRLPVFGPSSAEFLLCSNKALFNYADPFFF